MSAKASSTYLNWFVNNFFMKQNVEVRVVSRQVGQFVGRHSGPKGQTDSLLWVKA